MSAYQKLLPNRFEQLMGLYAENHALLGRLLQLTDTPPGRYRSQINEHPELILDVLGKAPYTSFLRLTHRLPDGNETEPCAYLRVYHDARQTEVTHCRYGAILHRLFLPDTPVRAIADHRLRMNVFCGKWLAYLLDLGHGRESFSWSGDVPEGLLIEAHADDDWWQVADRRLLQPKIRKPRKRSTAVQE